MLPPPNPPRAGTSSAPSDASSRYERGERGRDRPHDTERFGGDAAVVEDPLIWTPAISYSHGIFAGKVMRFYLEIAQHPVHGRRKTEKDRRPLAHVPILRLRARECWSSRHQSGWEEEDIDVSGIDPTLLVCSANITPTSAMSIAANKRQERGLAHTTRLVVPHPHATGSIGHDFPTGLPSDTPNPDSRTDKQGDTVMAELKSTPLPTWSSATAVAGPGPSSLRHRASWTADSDYNRGTQMFHLDLGAPHSELKNEDSPSPSRTSSVEGKSASKRRSRAPGKDDPGTSDADNISDDSRVPLKKIKTDSIIARNLYGALHVPAVRVPAPEGGMGLWFLFTDLCVRQEGSYTLLFRCFDLSILEGLSGTPAPPLAENGSREFKVYPPRTFPGLPRQTELSEYFSKQGFKLNTRKQGERHASPSETSTPYIPPATSTRPALALHGSRSERTLNTDYRLDPEPTQGFVPPVRPKSNITTSSSSRSSRGSSGLSGGSQAPISRVSSDTINPLFRRISPLTQEIGQMRDINIDSEGDLDDDDNQDRDGEEEDARDTDTEMELNEDEQLALGGVLKLQSSMRDMDRG